MLYSGYRVLIGEFGQLFWPRASRRFFFTFDSSEAYGADASDFTPLLAVAIILSILIGVGLHIVGANISRDAIIDLDLASKRQETEDKELQELRERLDRVEKEMDKPDTS